MSNLAFGTIGGVDDRGRHVKRRTNGWSDENLSPPEALQIKAVLRHAHKSRMLRFLQLSPARVTIFVLLNLLLIAGFAIWLWYCKQWPPVMNWMCLALTACAIWLWGRTSASLSWRYLKAGSMILKRCPACGYNLRGLDPDLDGCTVCPECHAAWILAPDDHAREAVNANRDAN